MTVYKFAQLGEWAEKQIRVMDAIVKQSTNDVIKQASKTATGVTRGGSVQKGYVPVDIGTLAASLQSTLYGSSSLTQGNGAYGLVVGSMRAGDVATFEWTAPYAKIVHNGSRGRSGWFWVDEAANDWQAIVARNVARAKAAAG